MTRNSHSFLDENDTDQDDQANPDLSGRLRAVSPSLSAQYECEATAYLDPRFITDTLAQKTAMNMVHDWAAQYFHTQISISSWTPIWKEITIRQPGNIFARIRFKEGGPVQIEQTGGKAMSEREEDKFASALLELLDQLGPALSQQRIADAIETQYHTISRHVEDDDSILLRFTPATITGPVASPTGDSRIRYARIHPNASVSIIADGQSAEECKLAVKRFMAKIQVAGLPLVRKEESQSEP